MLVGVVGWGGEWLIQDRRSENHLLKRVVKGFIWRGEGWFERVYNNYTVKANA